MFIGREPGAGPFVNWRKMAADTRAITDRLGLGLKPHALVRDLSVAEQQMVEIARALSMQSRLIVMDEPTSALSATEVEKLFRIIRDLKAHGLSIIFVTHRLEEVMQICDRYTVLRDGRQVGGGKISDTDVDGIIRLMVGRQVEALFAHREPARAGDVALRVEGLSRRGTAQDQNATVLDDVSLEVRRGEILGLAGLVGAGPHGDGARGVRRRSVRFRPRLHRRPARSTSARRRTPSGRGVGLVPEDRKQQALFLALGVRINLSMAAHEQFLRGGDFHRRGRRAAHGRGISQEAQYPHGEPGADDRQSFGRQSAEGRARPLAGACGRKC